MKVSIQLIFLVFFSLEEEVTSSDDSTASRLLVEYPIFFPNGKEYNWPYFISTRQEDNNEIIFPSRDENSKDLFREKFPFKMTELNNNHIDENPTNAESDSRRDKRSTGVHTHSHGHIHVHTHGIGKRRIARDVNVETEGKLDENFIKKQNLVDELKLNNMYENNSSLADTTRNRTSRGIHTHTHGHIHVHSHGVHKRAISENINKNLVQRQNSIQMNRNANSQIHSKHEDYVNIEKGIKENKIGVSIIKKQNSVEMKGERNEDDPTSATSLRKRRSHVHTHTHGHIHVHSHGIYKRAISGNLKNLTQQKNSILMKRNTYPGIHTKSLHDIDEKETKRLFDSEMTIKQNLFEVEGIDQNNSSLSTSLREKRSHGYHTHTHSHGHVHVHTHGIYKREISN